MTNNLSDGKKFLSSNLKKNLYLYYFFCSEGYVGDGITCATETEEKNNEQCHSEAYLVETDGKQKCICKPGYHGDGYNCRGNYVY